MANIIELIEKYMPILDEQYQYASKSAILDTPGEFLQAADNAKSFKVAKMVLDGLADYSRKDGYLAGDVELTWETHEFTQDRGRKFQVDDMDDLESLGLAFGRLAGEFNRMHVVPELDAYRFSKFAQYNGSAQTGALSADSILSNIDRGTSEMDDLEVPEEGRIIFVSPNTYMTMKNNVDIAKNMEVYSAKGPTGIETRITSYDGMRLIKVPQGRFKTAYDFLAGGAGSTGGFAPAAGASNIHLLMIHPAALLQVVKHDVSRIWAPSRAKSAGTDGVNPFANAWGFDMRVYHDCFVLDNKRPAIHVYSEGAITQLPLGDDAAQAEVLKAKQVQQAHKPAPQR